MASKEDVTELNEYRTARLKKIEVASAILD